MHLRCLNIAHKDKHAKHQAMLSTYRVFYTLEPMPREGKEEGRKYGRKEASNAERQKHSNNERTYRDTHKHINESAGPLVGHTAVQEHFNGYIRYKYKYKYKYKV